MWVACAGWMSGEIRSKSQRADASCLNPCIRRSSRQSPTRHTIATRHHDPLPRLLSWQSIPRRSEERPPIVEREREIEFNSAGPHPRYLSWPERHLQSANFHPPYCGTVRYLWHLIMLWPRSTGHLSSPAFAEKLILVSSSPFMLRSRCTSRFGSDHTYVRSSQCLSYCLTRPVGLRRNLIISLSSPLAVLSSALSPAFHSQRHE